VLWWYVLTPSSARRLRGALRAKEPIATVEYDDGRSEIVEVQKVIPEGAMKVKASDGQKLTFFSGYLALVIWKISELSVTEIGFHLP